jgi:hypothetical protein
MNAETPWISHLCRLLLTAAAVAGLGLLSNQMRTYIEQDALSAINETEASYPTPSLSISIQGPAPQTSNARLDQGLFEENGSESTLWYCQPVSDTSAANNAPSPLEI